MNPSTCRRVRYDSFIIAEKAKQGQDVAIKPRDMSLYARGAILARYQRQIKTRSGYQSVESGIFNASAREFNP